MSTVDIVNDFCTLFTGKDASDYVEKELGNKCAEITGLEDCRLIVGYDRIKKTLPAAFYPAIVLEVVGGSNSLIGTLPDGTIQLWLQIGVRADGRIGGLIGDDGTGVLDYVAVLKETILANPHFSSSLQNLVRIEDMGEVTTDGLFIGYRFYSVKITYRTCGN